MGVLLMLACLLCALLMCVSTICVFVYACERFRGVCVCPCHGSTFDVSMFVMCITYVCIHDLRVTNYVLYVSFTYFCFYALRVLCANICMCILVVFPTMIIVSIR